MGGRLSNGPKDNFSAFDVRLAVICSDDQIYGLSSQRIRYNLIGKPSPLEVLSSHREFLKSQLRWKDCGNM